MSNDRFIVDPQSKVTCTGQMHTIYRRQYLSSGFSGVVHYTHSYIHTYLPSLISISIQPNNRFSRSDYKSVTAAFLGCWSHRCVSKQQVTATIHFLSRSVHLIQSIFFLRVGRAYLGVIARFSRRITLTGPDACLAPVRNYTTISVVKE